MEGTSDYDLAVEWYLRFGNRAISEKERAKNYPQGSYFAIAGVATRDSEGSLWRITPKALKLIREHNGTNS